MTTKAQRAAEEAARLAEEEAIENGMAWHKAHPDALMVEASHEAARRYGANDYMQVQSFVAGFIRARHQKEAFEREKA